MFLYSFFEEGLQNVFLKQSPFLIYFIYHKMHSFSAYNSVVLVCLDCVTTITNNYIPERNRIPVSSHSPFCLSQEPLGISNCFVSLWICLFWKFYRNGIQWPDILHLAVCFQHSSVYQQCIVWYG